MFIRIYALSEQCLPQSFEAYCELLSGWPGMFVEPDGSFVWVMPHATGKLQLDGMIYDRNGHIEYVELKGSCTRAAWRRLCQGLFPDAIEDAGTALEVLPLRIHDVDAAVWSTASDILAGLPQDAEVG